MSNQTSWWTRYRKQEHRKRNYLNIELILRKSFLETLYEYFDACSIGGITQIRNCNNSRIQRMCWIFIFFLALSTVCTFLYSTWKTTFTRPLIVTSESFVYPINEIDFPAVALCNFNRISLKAIKAHASNISHRYKNISITEIEEYFISLGRLIDYRYDENIQRKINSWSLGAGPRPVDMKNLMQQLAPNCDEMLIKCQWAGHDVNCSDIFQTRRTSLGHCCAFNYVLELNAADSPTGVIAPVKRQSVPGSYNGLVIIADPLVEDYAYSLGSSFGFRVLIYDPQQFPDRAGGRVLYRMVQPDYAEFFQVDSIKQYATKEVQKYPRSTRQCLFHNEHMKTFNNMYSYSACLARCRIESIRSLCKCIPFFYPTGIYKTEQTCSLRHLRCLNKYKEKLLYLFPKDAQNTAGLEAESVDSLYCPDCLPDCELTQHFTRDYKVSFSKSKQTSFKNDFLDSVNLTNKCILNVYRSSPVGLLHRLDVVSYWFEILSNIGGFAGMIMGIGYYTFAEIIYFIFIRFTRIIYMNYNKYN